MKYGNFSLFGIGTKLVRRIPIKDTTEFEPGEEYSDGKFNSDMGVIGLDHKYFLNQKHI